MQSQRAVPRKPPDDGEGKNNALGGNPYVSPNACIQSVFTDR